jgi:hypothetical protein
MGRSFNQALRAAPSGGAAGTIIVGAAGRLPKGVMTEAADGEAPTLSRDIIVFF